MKREIKDRWVNALESGRYRQGFGILHRAGTISEEYCCLGVLSDLAYRDGVCDRELVRTNLGIGSFYRYGQCGVMSLSEEIVEWAGLNWSNPIVTYGTELRPLAYLNDYLHMPFSDIAITIKESL